MIAVRITDDLRMNVVASPNYLARHARPETPRDLQAHNCIRLRFPSGAFLPWRFSIEGETLELDVKGSLIANDADLLVRVALKGTGIVYVLRDFAAPFIATGQLVPLLEEWMPPPSDGFFLYYPSRRQNLASMRAFIEFLKKNAGSAHSVDAATQSKRQ
jgi:DNA-binding transcriptional LysR family regulator